jgi:hypothetical protein
MNLQLALKRKWFEMTSSEEKKEEYRELNLYWFKRLVFQPKKAMEYLNIKTDADVKRICLDAFWGGTFAFKPFTQNTMTLGYPKKGDKERIVILEHKGIEIRVGNPYLGAEPNKLYFVILHGKKIKN